MKPQHGYKLLKESGDDYLSFDGPDKEGKYFVYTGKNADTPFVSFNTYDEADDFVNKVHAIVNSIRSAANLRSFFEPPTPPCTFNKLFSRDSSR